MSTSIREPVDDTSTHDGDYSYDRVDIEDEDALVEVAMGVGDEKFDEDLDSMMRAVQFQRDRDAPPQVRADLTRLPEVVDDFIRNYFVKHSMHKTLEIFELEWYERFGANPDEDSSCVPDVYLENARLIETVKQLENELSKHRQISQKATTLWEHVKKERDMHRMNHSRVVQEKSKLSHDLRHLQTHAQAMEPTLMELRQKYEQVQKEKMLLRLEKEKLQSRIATLEESVRNVEMGGTKEAAKGSKNTTAVVAAPTWPQDERPNPFQTMVVKPSSNVNSWACRASFKAHSMAVTRAAIHPKKSVVATASEDGTWKLFALPSGELVMSGEGHKQWISGVALHPKGTMIATASGDKTGKLWDFNSHSCKATLKGHSEGLWSIDFQETGDLLATGSLDNSAKIWDVNTAKCKQTLRGHVDSVNSVVWIPYTNSLVTGGGDKTVSLWDCRVNHCAQTFYGHHNSVSSVAVTNRADVIASCDSEGVVMLWDVRMIAQKKTFTFGPHPANSVAFDRSGQILAVASDDSTIKVVTLFDDKVITLRGHDDAVQGVTFDPTSGAFLVSCGSDCTVRYWS